jgi:hypothetical protein
MRDVMSSTDLLSCATVVCNNKPPSTARLGLHMPRHTVSASCQPPSDTIIRGNRLPKRLFCSAGNTLKLDGGFARSVRAFEDRPLSPSRVEPGIASRSWFMYTVERRKALHARAGLSITRHVYNNIKTLAVQSPFNWARIAKNGAGTVRRLISRPTRRRISSKA